MIARLIVPAAKLTASGPDVTSATKTFTVTIQ
jgi:hypothetical protein